MRNIRLFTPLSQISKQLVEATLLQEDQYFRWHYGINPLAMTKAIWQTYAVKSRRIGASTITMQVSSYTLWNQFQKNFRKIMANDQRAYKLKCITVKMRY